MSRRVREAVQRAVKDLPPQQRRVAELLIEGKTDREIALVMRKSVFTIHNHAKLILKKFDVRTRAQLLAKIFGTAA